MKYKNITKGAMLLVAIFSFALSGCEYNKKDYEVISIENHVLEFRVYGYVEECVDQPRISYFDGKRWINVEALRDLDPIGQFDGIFIDDQYVFYGMCDIPVCLKYNDIPVIVNLVSYEPAGEKIFPADDPDNLSSKAYKLKAFRTVPLDGKIKIWMTIHQKADCSDSKPINITINR
jgi:hypothetical protein